MEEQPEEGLVIGINDVLNADECVRADCDSKGLTWRDGRAFQFADLFNLLHFESSVHHPKIFKVRDLQITGESNQNS